MSGRTAAARSASKSPAAIRPTRRVAVAGLAPHLARLAQVSAAAAPRTSRRSGGAAAGGRGRRRPSSPLSQPSKMPEQRVVVAGHRRCPSGSPRPRPRPGRLGGRETARFSRRAASSASSDAGVEQDPAAAARDQPVQADPVGQLRQDACQAARWSSSWISSIAASAGGCGRTSRPPRRRRARRRRSGQADADPRDQAVDTACATIAASVLRTLP